MSSATPLKMTIGSFSCVGISSLYSFNFSCFLSTAFQNKQNCKVLLLLRQWLHNHSRLQYRLLSPLRVLHHVRLRAARDGAGQRPCRRVWWRGRCHHERRYETQTSGFLHFPRALTHSRVPCHLERICVRARSPILVRGRADRRGGRVAPAPLKAEDFEVGGPCRSVRGRARASRVNSTRRFPSRD